MTGEVPDRTDGRTLFYLDKSNSLSYKIYTVLGATALTDYKETSQQVINLPPELSVMSLIC